MARQKGTANFSGTLEVQAGGPIDSRTIVPTKADLTVATNFQYAYVGMETYVVSENKKYRLIGGDITDLNNWEEVGGDKVSKESGKGLSTNDYTTPEKEKLQGLSNYDDTEVRGLIGKKADLVDGKVPASQLPIIGVGGGYAPIGTIIQYMGVTAPQDYLICDGTVYNIADYLQLANFFEAQFGSKNHFGGDGVTTFAVPDLRGEFLRGTGTNGHTNQGSGGNVGVHQNGTEIPMIYDDGISGIYARYDENNSNNPKELDSSISASVKKYRKFSSTTTGSPSSDSIRLTTRPTNTSVLFCIKAVVAGEVYSTDERAVGTWIDGKPIYQKTVVGNLIPISVPSTGIKIESIALNIPSGGNIINSRGFIELNKRSTNDTVMMQLNNTSEEYGTCYIIKSGDGSIRLNYGIFANSYWNVVATNKYYVTIQYTKTTD